MDEIWWADIIRGSVPLRHPAKERERERGIDPEMKMSGCLTREMNRWVRSREPQRERGGRVRRKRAHEKRVEQGTRERQNLTTG